MEQENKTVRINIRMAEEMKTWYEKEAGRDGIPYSALMCIALRKYMEDRLS